MNATRLVIVRNLKLEDIGPRPQHYRELIDYRITLDSLRGLPIVAAMFVPGGFVALGACLYFLPTWAVLPKTFWNRKDMENFVNRQFAGTVMKLETQNNVFLFSNIVHILIRNLFKID